jgi:hypothetical protein
VNEVQSLLLDPLSRPAATIFGLFLFILTTISLLRTAVVPRALGSVVSQSVAWSITRVHTFIASRRSTYVKQDAVLAWNGPLIIVGQLLTWLVLYFFSYGLWMYGIGGFNLADALRESGSSLFTLGFADTNQIGPTTLSFMAAATGPIVIALLISFLPTIYGAYIDREVTMSRLGISGGQPTWGPELLARLTLNQRLGDIAAHMAAWTQWNGHLRLTHTTYPVLIQIRSPSPWRHWVIATLAVMDAASMHLSLNKSHAHAECTETIINGTLTLETIYSSFFVRTRKLNRIPFVGRFFGAPTPLTRLLTNSPGYQPGAVAFEKAATADSARGFSAEAIHRMVQGSKDGIQLTKEEFVSAAEMLKECGYPTDVDFDTAWEQFRVSRSRYEFIAYELAYALDVVPAPWSGKRNTPFDTVWPTSANEIYQQEIKNTNTEDKPPTS